MGRGVGEGESILLGVGEIGDREKGREICGKSTNLKS